MFSVRRHWAYPSEFKISTRFVSFSTLHDLKCHVSPSRTSLRNNWDCLDIIPFACGHIGIVRRSNFYSFRWSLMARFQTHLIHLFTRFYKNDKEISFTQWRKLIFNFNVIKNKKMMRILLGKDIRHQFYWFVRNI